MSPLELLRRRLLLAAMHGRLWLGAAGLTGLGLIALGVGAALFAPALTEEALVLHGQYEAESARLRDVSKQRAQDPTAMLHEFHDGFPESAQYLADLRAIFRIAREQKVQLMRGDYATGRRADARLATCEVILPVKTSYSALRAFVAAVLNALPHASLAELRLERSGGSQLDARVHLTLYYREG